MTDALGFMALEDSVLSGAFENANDSQGYSSTPAACEARSKCGFVGLSNQGATCYLNSAIQSLFMCPEFRAAIFELSPEELNVASYEDEEKEKIIAEQAAAAQKQSASAPSKPPRFVPDPEDVAELVSVFGFSESQARKALRKFPSAGQRESAINYLVDGQISDDSDVEDISSSPVVEDKASESEPVVAAAAVPIAAPRPKPRRIPIELQRLFARLQGLDAHATSTERLTDSFGWGGGGRVAVQQDVFELTTQLMDALERSLKNTSGASLVTDMFKFKMVNRILCKECHNVSVREEDYLGLPITVQGCKTLHEAFAQTCALEMFSGNNLYRCSSAQCDGKKSEAGRSSAFRSLPPIFLLNLNRFTWNENGERVKLTHRCAFPLVLDMRPYREASLEIHRIVDGSLKPSCPPYAPEACAADPEALKQDEKKGSKKRKGKRDDESEEPVAVLEQPPINLNSPDIYDLFAVLIHAGTPYGGHYTGNIKDQLIASQSADSESSAEEVKVDHSKMAATGEPPGDWFSFNDSLVRPLPRERLAVQYGGRKGETAYMLFYRRRDLGQVVNPVIPNHLQTILDVENKATLAERLAHDRFMNTLTLTLHVANDFSRSGAAAPLHHSQKTPDIVLTIDRRVSLSTLQNEVAHAISVARAGLGLQSESDSAECTAAHLKFAVVDLKSSENVALYKMRAGDSLQACGLKDFDHLLCLFSDQFLGQPISYTQRNGQRLQVTCTQLSPTPFDDSSEEESQKDSSFFRKTFVFVGEKDVSTISDLVVFLNEHTRLPGKMCIHLLKYDKLVPLDFDSRIGSVLLAEVPINDNAVLFIEPEVVFDSEANSSPVLAQLELLRQSASISLIIVHACASCNGDGDQGRRVAFDVRLETHVTLAALKACVVSRLPDACRLGHAAQGFRLRRVIGQDKAGPMYCDESLSLTGADLDDEYRVQIEHGPLPGPNQAEVKVSIKNPDSQARSEVTLLLELKWTVKEVKKMILSTAGIERPPQEFCLYRYNTDMTWDERGKLFSNENMSMEKFNIVTGDCLWIEIGEIPSKGLVNLDFYRYIPHKNSQVDFVRQKLLEHHSKGLPLSSMGCNDETPLPTSALSAIAELESAAQTVSQVTPAAESASESADTRGDAALAAALENENEGEEKEKDTSGIAKLFSLEAQQNDNLLDLKQALHSQKELAHLPSIDYLRVRLFRGHQVGKLVPCVSQPLKKQGITADRSLVVEILTQPDPEWSIFAIALQVYLAIPVGDDLQFSLFPLDLMWDGALEPDYQSLNVSVAKQIKVPSESTCLAKWLHTEKRWQLISAQTHESELAILIAAEEKKKKEKEEAAAEKVRMEKLMKSRVSDGLEVKGDNDDELIVDVASLSDEELAAMLAEGLDLATGRFPKKQGKGKGKEKGKGKGKGKEKHPNESSEVEEKSHKEPKEPKEAREPKEKKGMSAEKELEQRGLRGRPFLLKDGDILVAVDLRDWASRKSDASTDGSSNLDAFDSLAVAVAAWSPPPGAIGGSAGPSDVERAIAASLTETSGSSKRGAAPEVGIEILVDVE